MFNQANIPTCAFGLQLGTVISIDNEDCRIANPNKDGSVTFVSYRTGRHFDLTRDEFAAKLNAGAVLIDQPKAPRTSGDSGFLSAMLYKAKSGITRLDLATYRAEFVKALLAVPVGERRRSLAAKLIHKIHREYVEKWGMPEWLSMKAPPGVSTVYRWLKISERKANLGLLVPSIHLRGARGSKLHPIIEGWIADLSEKYYFQTPEAQISSAVVSIRKEIADRISASTSLRGETVPSRSTIFRRIEVSGGERRLEHEEGKRTARLTYKQVMQGPDFLFPMARWEIDHTKIDINVVDNEGNSVLGRVWLTCIIDHKTRMIAGYILDARHPDSSTVLAALRYAMSPKTRAALDALGVVSDVPIFGECDELASDLGREIISAQVKRALRVLGIRLAMMPPRTPQSKGRIERFFGTLNTLLFHQLAGTTKSNPAAKGDRKPEVEARITFNELNRLIARTIFDVYHNKRHSALRCSPLQMWNRMTEKYPVRPIKSAEELRQATLMSYEAKATREGIRIEGIQYGSVEVARLRSYAHAHVRKNPIVEVLLDPEDVSKIYLRDPKSGQAVEVPALSAPYLKGVSLRKHRFIQAEMDARNVSDSPDLYEKYLSEMTAEYRHMNRRRRKSNVSRTTKDVTDHSDKQASQRMTKRSVAKTRINTTMTRGDEKAAKPATPRKLPNIEKFDLDE